jgi:hypothetical protein
MSIHQKNRSEDTELDPVIATEEAASDVAVSAESNNAVAGRAARARAARQVQAKADASGGEAASEQGVLAAAQEGTTGSPTALPHANRIQASFGRHDVSGIEAHVGGPAAAASEAMGAQAFATGSSVAFASQPSVHTAAHEAAHVVQQRGGVQLKGDVGQAGDRYEQHADAVADAVVQGQPAEALLDEMAGDGAGNGVQQQAVQRYQDFSSGGKRDDSSKVHWAANNYPLRVSDDGSMAVGRASIAGSQEAYTESSKVAGANAKLTAANAPFQFEEGGATVKGGTPKDLSGMKTLTQIKAVKASDKSPLTTPDDCGNAARTVTGAFAENKTLRTRFNDKDGASKTTGHSDPELMKYEIMLDHFSASIPGAGTILTDLVAEKTKMNTEWAKLEPFKDDINKVYTDIGAAVTAFNDAKAVRDAAAAAGQDTTAGDAAVAEAVKKYKAAKAAEVVLKNTNINGETLGDILTRYWTASSAHSGYIAAIMKPYEDQGAVDKEAFDKKVGINRHSNPDIGEAYTISSGGDAKKDASGDPITTWNFHWGGVVMKSGGDNVTLENFAGSQEDDWVMQMYGVPTVDDERKGQTFQEQHRDDHEQHGETPTTLTTEKT